MLKIAICDDSRTDIEMLESAFDKLCQYPIEYDVYFKSAGTFPIDVYTDILYITRRNISSIYF